MSNQVCKPHELTSGRGLNHCLTSAGAANDREADPPGEEYRQGSLRRGVEGKVARGERRRQDLLHNGGGELVQGDRALPDCPAEA